MSPKYFYIICRDGQIIEVPAEKRKFEAVISAQMSKELVSIPDCGVLSLNGVDISKVLDETQYKNYISSVNPREYIRRGTWYDGKERGVLRYEPWKQKQIDEVERQKVEDRKKLASGEKVPFPPFPTE